MSNTAFLTLNLLDVRRQPAPDPQVRIRAVRGESPGGTVSTFPNLTFPPVPRLELKAFPQVQVQFLEVTPKRYRACKTDFFTLSDGEDRTYDLRVLREPKQWKALFAAWSALPADCQELRTVLDGSTVKLMGGANLGKFTEAAYDRIGNQVTDNRSVHAKAALLNLFAKLRLTPEPIGGRNPWFSFVREILAIDRERLYALVDVELGEIVKRIREKPDDFPHYRRADSSQHGDKIAANLPDYRIFRSKLFSVKTDERFGNLQLTCAPAQNAAGQDVLILDADIDENGDLLNHLLDVILLHPISGGTHPYDIHEYLLRAHTNLALGYTLV